MKMLKSEGPKIDPRCIPVIMPYQELKEKPIFVYDYLGNQKEYLNLFYPDHISTL